MDKLKVLLLFGVVFSVVLSVFGVPYVYDMYKAKVISIDIGDDVFYIVSSTEYIYGADGQIVVRFVTSRDVPVMVDNCTVDIVFPNQTYYIQGGLLVPGLVSGDHYYDFTVPDTEGVYDYSATCIWGDNSRSSSKTFHVSPSPTYTSNQSLIAEMVK